MIYKKPKLLERAEEAKHELRLLTLGKKHENINYTRARDLAEETADYYQKLGNLPLAEKFYSEALSYAGRSGGVGEIQDKLNKLRTQSDKLLVGFKKAGIELDRKHSLEKKIAYEDKSISKSRKRLGAAFLSIASLAAALFSVSFGFTGNAIGNIESGNFKWIGMCFFACGLVFLFAYLNAKKK
jgi:hypothetical protein